MKRCEGKEVEEWRPKVEEEEGGVFQGDEVDGAERTTHQSASKDRKTKQRGRES